MKPLRIWLLQSWEPNPLDDARARPWRTGMLARRLSAAGHEVTWWASAFSHTSKRFRHANHSAIERVSDGLTIRLIPALGYRRHVSFQRLRDHAHVAREWSKLVSATEPPDIIVASYPTIELCEAAAAYAKTHRVPLLIDIRDQYPDLYWENAPEATRAVVRALCGRARRSAQSALGGADGITANGPDVVGWGLRYANRGQGPLDRVVYMSYEPPEVSAEEEERARAFWDDQRLGNKVIAYTGMIGQTLAFEPVLAAARELAHDPEVTFVFCGGGDALERARTQANGLSNVRLPGWQKAPEVVELLRRANLGLVPYQERANFETGITNKPVEYLANGLPILTSLRRGVLVEMLQESRAGASYDNANPASLVEAVRLWTNDADAPARARALFKANFHPDAVYGDWIKLIESAASARGAR